MLVCFTLASLHLQAVIEALLFCFPTDNLSPLHCVPDQLGWVCVIQMWVSGESEAKTAHSHLQDPQSQVILFL